jgi:hypothetical protein
MKAELLMENQLQFLIPKQPPRDVRARSCTVQTVEL